MPGKARGKTLLTRRRFLARSAQGVALAGLGHIASPYLSFAASRPVLTHGLQSGDIADNAGIVWARADRASRLVIEASTTENFSDICCTTFADALPESDFTAKVLLEDLPAGQEIFYRVTPHDLASSCRARRGADRTLPHRALGYATGLVRLVRRRGGAGLGHR